MFTRYEMVKQELLYSAMYMHISIYLSIYIYIHAHTQPTEGLSLLSLLLSVESPNAGIIWQDTSRAMVSVRTLSKRLWAVHTLEAESLCHTFIPEKDLSFQQSDCPFSALCVTAGCGSCSYPISA